MLPVATPLAFPIARDATFCAVSSTRMGGFLWFPLTITLSAPVMVGWALFCVTTTVVFDWGCVVMTASFA